MLSYGITTLVALTCFLAGMLLSGALLLLYAIESGEISISLLPWKQEHLGETTLIGGQPPE